MRQSENSKIVVAVIVIVVAASVFTRWTNRLWYGPGAEPRILSFEDDDSEMNSAMADARLDVKQFKEALAHRNPSRSHFSIKVGFQDQHGNEYIWLNDVRCQDGVFFGTVGNVPQTVTTVRFGLPVTVPQERIADWMYIEDRRLVGGYTMRVMRSRLSDQERAEFDANIGFIIE